jgi:uncharacterized protein YneF (UPF0154 family)
VTLGHLVYVPIILLIGMAFGYVLGAKAVRRELEDARKRAKI